MSKKINLSDRIAIETGLLSGQSLAAIAASLGRHPSSISNEIKNNRYYVPGRTPFDNDCKFAPHCQHKHLCGDENCSMFCARCRRFSCHDTCDKYISTSCLKLERPPYVCNNCGHHKICRKNRYSYSAKYAEDISAERRSLSRRGIHCTSEELQRLDTLITPLIKKGQPLSHIYAEHSNDIPISQRTLYEYIASRKLSCDNFDLRRKVSYRQRKKPKKEFNQSFRYEHTYQDFQKYIHEMPTIPIVQMDTVKGKATKGKVLLTMLFVKTHVMLIFLMPNARSSSVISVFNYIEANLGNDVFRRLFPVILTDNGSEFKRINDLEYNSEYIFRTSIFYCDPMASRQKAELEKNHEYIRYVLPKGTSFNNYTQDDITLLMNHINSTKRPSLDNKSPYELLDTENQDIQKLMNLLKMHPIQADEVHLKPDLL